MTDTNNTPLNLIKVEVPKKQESHNGSSKLHSENADKKESINGQAIELNGPKGLEPTRYGDWESKGRCHDF